MSLPPATVRIKRKATDDPVEYLRMSQTTITRQSIILTEILGIRELGGKRHRQGDGSASSYAFTRQPVASDPAASQLPSTTPRIIKPLPHSTNSTLRQATSIPAPQPPIQALSTTNTTPSACITKPRHFHISKSKNPSHNSNGVSGGSRKRRGEPIVFAERRIRPKSGDGAPGDSATVEEKGGNDVKTTLPTQTTRTPQVVTSANQEQPQKKPGRSATKSDTPVRPVTPPKSSPAPLRNVLLPDGSRVPWDVTDDGLAAAMQAYTLQEIGKSIAASETPRPSPQSSRLKSRSKFTPKKPALRYLERHPEHKVDTSMDVDEEYIVEDMDDDSEYVIDTYVRVPVDVLETEEGHKNIGLLILDSQPDIDEFYREDEESEEEEDDLDEDENGMLLRSASRGKLLIISQPRIITPPITPMKK